MVSRFEKITSLLPLPRVICSLIWDYMSISTGIARLLEMSCGEPVQLTGQNLEYILGLCKKQDDKIMIDKAGRNVCIYLRTVYSIVPSQNYIGIISFRDKWSYVCNIVINEWLTSDNYIQWIPELLEKVNKIPLCTEISAPEYDLQDYKWSSYLWDDSNVLVTLKNIRDQLTSCSSKCLMWRPNKFGK